MVKLTLSMDRSVVREAKRLAKARKISVSAMFSQFVRSMASLENRPPEISPLVRKLTGILKLPPGKDYKEFLTDALMEKYGIESK